jgi:hypothetical protein
LSSQHAMGWGSKVRMRVSHKLSWSGCMGLHKTRASLGMSSDAHTWSRKDSKGPPQHCSFCISSISIHDTNFSGPRPGITLDFPTFLSPTSNPPVNPWKYLQIAHVLQPPPRHCSDPSLYWIKFTDTSLAKCTAQWFPVFSRSAWTSLWEKDFLCTLAVIPIPLSFPQLWAATNIYLF